MFVTSHTTPQTIYSNVHIRDVKTPKSGRSVHVSHNETNTWVTVLTQVGVVMAACHTETWCLMSTETIKVSKDGEIEGLGRVSRV